MAGLKRYVASYCNDCDVEFLSVPFEGHGIGMKKYYCTHCGDSIATEKLKDIWIPRLYSARRNWTAQEDALIFYAKDKGMTWEDVSEALPYRTASAVRNRAGKLIAAGKMQPKGKVKKKF